jgi:hypothetical protein
MGTVYRDVHRIYFWHILITTDLSFRHHLYRTSNIGSGTWKVDLPDSSTRQSLSNIDRDTELFFEATLRLSLIELEFSELENNGVLRESANGLIGEPDQAKIRDLLLEIDTVLSEWQIVSDNIFLLCVHASCSFKITGAIDGADIFRNHCMAIRSFDLARNINDNQVSPISASQRRVATRTRQGTRA